MKLQHQIESCYVCFQSPLKTEFVKFPIEKANLRNPEMQAYWKKKILHHVANKMLGDLYKQFHRVWHMVQYTSQENHIFSQNKWHRNNIPFSWTKHQEEKEGKSGWMRISQFS